MSSICLPAVAPLSNQDCLELHRAFEGLGCDGARVIRVLAHRTAAQRAEIKEVYQNMYKESLCKRLKSELHFDFEKAMLLWMQNEPDRDATILKGALKCKASKRNAIFAEVLSLKSTSELESIARAYAPPGSRSLQEDIESTFSNSSQKLFRQYFEGNRDDTAELEPRIARDEAMNLFNAGEGSSSLDENAFIRILTTRSRQQLSSIFDAYESLYEHEIHKGLNSFKSGGATEFLQIVSTITRCVSHPANYFAKVLYKSMKGLGTDDDTLIRTVVTRAEVDMAEIKTTFLQNYNKSLAAMIISDTSGNYRKFLLALIGAGTDL